MFLLKFCHISQPSFYSEKLVIFLYTLSPAWRSGFYLSGIEGYCDICDDRIGCLAGAMGDHGLVAGIFCHLNSVECLCQCSDLVHFYKDGIGYFPLNPCFQPFCVCYKQIVSHKLYVKPQSCCQKLPTVPVFFVQRILQGDNGKSFDQFFVVINQLL